MWNIIGLIIVNGIWIYACRVWYKCGITKGQCIELERQIERLESLDN